MQIERGGEPMNRDMEKQADDEEKKNPNTRVLSPLKNLTNISFPQGSSNSYSDLEGKSFLRKFFNKNTHAGRADRLSFFLLLISGLVILAIIGGLYLKSLQLHSQKSAKVPPHPGVSSGLSDDKLSVGEIPMDDQIEMMNRQIAEIKKEREAKKKLQQLQREADKLREESASRTEQPPPQKNESVAAPKADSQPAGVLQGG
jgi:hypothetical protein